jgi:hypothetical protein
VTTIFNKSSVGRFIFSTSLPAQYSTSKMDICFCYLSNCILHS